MKFFLWLLSCAAGFISGFGAQILVQWYFTTNPDVMFVIGFSVTFAVTFVGLNLVNILYD